ncbi:hypothetical protein [Xenorhabdus sp. BG5]|uniref:hypothetical protein n=1 Tax=Xenorhabdus sp. BG5 TaxID=2782014 RepID=UPI00187E3B36|nr:hypothetical protein [Xenorhabdus sp. BG5]MBE8596277.1 hypothetical protein [Xenorhabdus sp. BG5]
MSDVKNNDSVGLSSDSTNDSLLKYMQQAIDDNKKDIENNRKDIENNSIAIAVNKQELDDTLPLLRKSVTDLSTSITANQQAVDNKVASLEQSVANFSKSIDVITANQQAVDNKVASLEQSVANLSKEVINGSQLQTVQDTIEANKKDIESNKDLLDTTNLMTEENARNIIDIITRVSTLEKRIQSIGH